MFREFLKLKGDLKKINLQGHIVIEYPFVEYNPLFLIMLFFLKNRNKERFKIVVSLHEYSRTKFFRKLFIRGLIPLSDIVLFTKEEDITPFKSDKILFKKRIIPANIVPSSYKKTEPYTIINMCYFGIVNLETKAIENMIKGWNLYCSTESNKRIFFHFISSDWDDRLEKSENVTYHIGLDDTKTSLLLNEMHYMILPLLPKISINNGSLAVGCAHKCVPVGNFDSFFEKNFGIRMGGYSQIDFLQTYRRIKAIEYNDYKEKVAIAYDYGKTRLPSETAKIYTDLVINQKIRP